MKRESKRKIFIFVVDELLMVKNFFIKVVRSPIQPVGNRSMMKNPDSKTTKGLGARETNRKHRCENLKQKIIAKALRQKLRYMRSTVKNTERKACSSGMLFSSRKPVQVDIAQTIGALMRKIQ